MKPFGQAKLFESSSWWQMLIEVFVNKVVASYPWMSCLKELLGWCPIPICLELIEPSNTFGLAEDAEDASCWFTYRVGPTSWECPQWYEKWTYWVYTGRSGYDVMKEVVWCHQYTSTLALLSTQLSLLDPFIACWRWSTQWGHRRTLGISSKLLPNNTEAAKNMLHLQGRIWRMKPCKPPQPCIMNLSAHAWPWQKNGPRRPTRLFR